MKARDLLDLMLLGAIWGASFLFMRLSSPEFGPLTLAFLRVAGAALLLLPILAWRHGLQSWRGKGSALLAAGFLNSALPFALYAYAALHLPTALSSILNATVPMWGAVVAWVWLGQRPGPWRVLGLALGFAGVSWLVLAKSGASLEGETRTLAVLACALATLNYAIGAVATKRWLGDVPPVAVAAGSQLGASLCLLPFGLWAWPSATPSPSAWLSLLALSLLCTGVAYLFYFRLMHRIGPTQAVTVTFLIPVFAVIWGAVFLHEALTLSMLGGGLLVLAGTALALGLWPRR
ncbi:drug/metabolite transporter (DMT)-like permease [Inhella inkyongensis]|uniref:Drug/metabolite transporter (DMT)-like permease n=1 Tax=Inhella inkyongensis TaxID=392593 RepID=A0A840S3N8_9BURK|nr:DMT family transporter [Inhella inkyongensis]MBB5204162.1 drug/metabolite transporter (DMT)-like permease [Inhella inkyongensis]